MKSRDFCYWLQGYFEVSGKGEMTKEQVATVKKHLEMVFKHEIDPSFGDDLKSLRAIHDDPGRESPIMC